MSATRSLFLHEDIMCCNKKIFLLQKWNTNEENYSFSCSSKIFSFTENQSTTWNYCQAQPKSKHRLAELAIKSDSEQCNNNNNRGSIKQPDLMWKKSFGPYIFLKPKICLTQTFFKPWIFRPQIFFGPQIFWTQNLIF